RTPRGLDRQLVRSLTAESAWVREHQHLFLIGPTGVGKTWLARAFAHKACRDGFTALFLKAAELFRDLAMSRADGSHGKLLDRLSSQPAGWAHEAALRRLHTNTSLHLVAHDR